MMERIKTVALISLVALSLLQSYLLAYSMPGLVATVRSDQDYVTAEPLGATASVESVIFPEELVIHMGDDRHTVIYPGTQFYDMILKQRIVGREFKGFQRGPASVLDWEEIRKNDIGIELRFGGGLSVELLQKLLKLEGDMMFLNEKIERIWIFKTKDTEEIRTFFFSNDGQNVYESVRADLTVRDVQDYVGFGQYLPLYRMTVDGLYIPIEPMKATEMVFPYKMYSPEQMLSLFFDPSTTRAIEDRSGSQIFTDGKRGLKVEQNGMWINYTNPGARQSGDTPLSENVYSSVDFINQHGGWDGIHKLMSLTPEQEKKYVTFRKYVEQYPVIDTWPFRYGYMSLTLEQGVVTEYSRSLLTLANVSESRSTRWLQGGEVLEDRLDRYARREEVTALFPALKAVPLEENRLQFVPVWAVRLAGGTEEILMEAYPQSYEPPIGDDTEAGADGEAGDEESASAGSGASNTPASSAGRQPDAAGADDTAGSEEQEGEAPPEGEQTDEQEAPPDENGEPDGEEEAVDTPDEDAGSEETA